jgi:integrase
VQALTALRKCQLADSAAAGIAYQAGLDGLDWQQGGDYVVLDELGMPVHPEWYSDEFGRLLKRAGLRRITLHDSQHTTLTLLEHAGVPISIVSKWRATMTARSSSARTCTRVILPYSKAAIRSPAFTRSVSRLREIMRHPVVAQPQTGPCRSP